LPLLLLSSFPGWRWRVELPLNDDQVHRPFGFLPSWLINFSHHNNWV
jgi:hypothetical protein